MVTEEARKFPKLLAPREDMGLLLWPEPRQLLRETWDNHRELRGNSRAHLLDIPLGQVRGWMRRWMGHPQDQTPVIGTGHQTELHHPGVWVKNAVIHAIAQRIGASAIHFAVDTDAPKHLVYRWPGGGRPLTDDPNLTRSRWSGLLKPPGSDHLTQLRSAISDASRQWGYEPATGAFLDTLQRHAGSSHSLSSALADAQLTADTSLGLKNQVIVASDFLRTNGYLLFVYDVCANAEAYACSYNKALTDFRVANGITSPGRPMPDLTIESDFCEVPFWIDDLADGSRKRAGLWLNEGHWHVRFGEESFRFERDAKDGWVQAERLAKWLAGTRLRLSPRALTLTSFLRLVVVDQFVHGIGGALYDQVTDQLIGERFGIQPPAFSVATATMYLPQAASRQRTCLECLQRDGRRLRHSILGERKMALVRGIAQAPRRSSERALLFSQMHRELDEAVLHDTRMAAHQQEYEEARRQHEMDQVLFDRELPYTLQSRGRLEAMITRVTDAFA